MTINLSTIVTSAMTGVQGIQGIAGPANIPQNSQTISYTIQASDIGKHISTTAGVTVPVSVLNAGDVVTIYNSGSGAITITQATNVTLRLGGTTTTGNRTLAQYGITTLLCVTGGATPTIVISGAGLT
jgi:hypothetical protein